MKRYILYIMLLFYTSTLSAAITEKANIYDRELIVKDFVDRNIEKYKKDNLSFFKKDIVLSEYLSNDYQTHVVPTYTKGADNNFREVFLCPSGNDEFSTSLYRLNPYTLTMTCLIAKQGVLEKPLGLFYWKLSDYPNYDKSFDNFLQIDRKKAILDNQSLISASEDDFQSIQDSKVQFSNVSNVNGANTKIPHLLFGTILGDNDLIDIQSTIDLRKIVLKDGFKMTGSNFLRTKSVLQVSANDAKFTEVYDVSIAEAGGYLEWMHNIYISGMANIYNQFGKQLNETVLVKKLSDTVVKDDIKSSDLLVNKLIGILDFYPRFNTLNQDFFLLLLAVIGLVGVVLFGSSRIIEFINDENQQKKSHISFWASTIVISTIAFLPVTKETINIEGKELSLTQNNFNKFEKSAYYLGIDFSNGISKILIDSEINSMLRKTGSVSTESLINTLARNEVLNLEKDIYSDFLVACSAVYDHELLKNYSDNKDYYYPISEQWTFASYTAKGRVPRYYMPVSEGGLLNFDNDGKYPQSSISFCRSADVRMFEKLKPLVKSGEDLILSAASGLDQTKISNLNSIIKAQYGMYEEWGFMSILTLPGIKYRSEAIGTLFEPEKVDTATKLLDEERGEDILKDIAYSSTLFLIPGVGSLYTMIKDNGAKIGAAIGTSIGLQGTVIGGILGFLGSNGIAFVLVKNFIVGLIEYLPSITVTVIGLLVILKIILKAFAYHLMAPFVLVIAFSKRNSETVINFISRVLSIVFEIVLFPLSIYAAMSSIDILKAVGTPLSSTPLKIMSDITHEQSGENWNILEHSLDLMAQGLVFLLLNIFATVIAYKILTTFHKMIFEAFEIKTASAFDDAVDAMSQSAQGWGQRI